MMGVLASDLIKFRKTWIKALVLLGPFGVVSLTGVRYALNYHGMVHPDSQASWPMLIQNINFLLIPTLVLGVALMASLMTGMEHQGHTWKQLLALPIPRYKILLSKFVWLIAFVAVACALAVVGTVLLGWMLGFHPHVPWQSVLQEGFFPYLASYALIAIQILLSVLVSNQALSISVGVMGVIASFARGLIPNWVPWVYPSRAAPYGIHAGQAVGMGMLVCFFMLCLGTYLFSKHQVK